MMAEPSALICQRRTHVGFHCSTFIPLCYQIVAPIKYTQTLCRFEGPALTIVPLLMLGRFNAYGLRSGYLFAG
jgi:hypothetical protein